MKYRLDANVVSEMLASVPVWSAKGRPRRSPPGRPRPSRTPMG